MEEAIRRLATWARGGKAGPETVQIYPTNVCNLKCIFCCQVLGEYDFKDTVPTERWLAVAHEICELDTRSVLISGGGEPLAVPEVTIPLMRTFKAAGIKGRMINNGTLWKQEMIEETADIGWDDIVFSLDGPDAPTHDTIRAVPGAFDKTIACIRSFNATKGGDPDRPPKIELTMVLTKDNFRTVPGMIELAHGLGIKNLTVEPVCVNNRDVEKMKITEDQRKEFFASPLARAEELAEEFGISTNFHKLHDVTTIEKAGNLEEMILEMADGCAGHNDGGPDPEDSHSHPQAPSRQDEPPEPQGPALDPGASEFLSLPCYEPWIWPKIEANGEVWPCSTSPLKVNIRDQSFTDIWYGEEFEAFRARIREGRLSESCSNCVVTHLSTNREISRQLREHIESRLP